MRLLDAAACIAALWVAEACQSAVVLNTQTRTISANARSGSTLDVQSLSAPDFAPWNQSVNALAGSNSASASQDSTVSVGGVSYHAIATATSPFDAAGGQSNCSVGFSIVGSPVSISVTSSFLFTDASDVNFVSALLTGPGGTLFSWNANIFGSGWAYNFASTLAPGNYSLSLSAGAGRKQFATTTSRTLLDFSLVLVPAPSSAFIAMMLILPGIRRRRG